MNGQSLVIASELRFVRQVCIKLTNSNGVICEENITKKVCNQREESKCTKKSNTMHLKLPDYCIRGPPPSSKQRKETVIKLLFATEKPLGANLSAGMSLQFVC